MPEDLEKQIRDIIAKVIEMEFEKIGPDADFIIEDKIIVELKSVLHMPVYEKQLYHYLRGSEYRLGYIVNFGSENINIRRRIF